MLEKWRKKTQVVIVGAGPTGLTAANLLGLYGIDTLLLERHPTPGTLPKAVVIDDEGLRICQALGLHNEILQHIRLDLKVEYRSGKQLLALITPQNQPNGYPLISTFHQPMLETIFLRGLTRFSSVRICFGHTVEAFTQTSEEVLLQVRTPEGTLYPLTCTYLLACDGGKSSIRHALSIPLRPISPLPFSWGKAADTVQRWLVADIQDAATSEQQNIIFFCNPSRPAVMVPTPEQTRRWEFMLFPGENEETLLRPGMLQTLISQTYRISGFSHSDENPPAAAIQVTRQAIYTFHALLASSFSQGRVFLLGDAAHLMPPFGGQGLNSGLRDAYNLCWKLASVLQENASEELLQTYEQERMLHTSRMIHFSALLGHAIMPTRRSLALARDLFFHSINLIPPIRQSLKEMQVKPGASYQIGYLPLLIFGQKHALIGTLLPQVRVMTEEKQLLLLDDILIHDPKEVESSALNLLPQQKISLEMLKRPGRITPHQAFPLLRLYEEKQTLKGEILFFTPSTSRDVLKQGKDFIVVEGERALSRIARQARGGWLLLRPDHFILDVLF